MNPDPQDFSDLQKLMALKRHETPPPGYMDRLPGNIVSRIEAGEGRLGLWERISTGFAAHPALSYACGLTLCGLLGVSATFLARQGLREARNASGDAAWQTAAAGSFSNRLQAQLPAMHVANFLRDTNPGPEMHPAISLFDTSVMAVPLAMVRTN